MRRILFIFLIVAFCQANAQQYLIKYDLLKDQASFFRVNRKKDTVAISKITTRASSKVVLDVHNFNPFYWKAKATAYRRISAEGNASPLRFGLMSFLGKGFSSLLSGSFPPVDIPGFLTRGEAESPEDKLAQQASMFKNYYNELSTLHRKYDEINETLNHLELLKYDHAMTEPEIKTSVTREIEKLSPSMPAINSAGIIQEGIFLEQRSRIARDSLRILNRQIQSMTSQLDADTRISRNKTVSDISSEVKHAMVFVDSAAIKELSLADQFRKVADLYYEIMETPFTYQYTLISDPDITDIKLEAYPLKATSTQDTITKLFPLQNGSLKLKNSVGIAFTYFDANYHSFYVRSDTTIGRERGNLFVPVLATYMHFYSTGRSSFKWGGTLGFGIPLLGEEKDFHFLLGLSTLVGRNEPIIITAGIAGARVSKLKGAYQPGSKVLVQDMSNFTRKVYDLGAFLSISVNLGAVNSPRK